MLLVSFALFSCSDDDKPTNPTANSKIISFSPQQGAVGDKVAISVEGFSLNKSELVVKFSNAPAAIDSIANLGNSKNIYVRVPEGATTGLLSITYKDKIYYSSQQFTVITTGGELLPIEQGYYWVYKKYVLDDFGNPILDSYGLDSLYGNGVKNILGRAAEHVLCFSKGEAGDNYERTADQYYYEDQGDYYAHSSWFDDLMNFGGGGFALPFDINEQWLKIQTNKQSEWRIYSRTFANEALSFGTLNGELTLDGINLGSDNINIDGTAYNNAQVVNYRFKFVGSAQTQFGNIPLNLERTFTNWYVNGIGKVRTFMNPMPFKVQGLADQIIPGFELRLYKSKTN